jgi:phytoene dehydrogenase-like protein
VSGVDVRTLAGTLLHQPPRALRSSARTLRNAPRSRVVHLGLADRPDDLPHETVFHGDEHQSSPTITVHAPDDAGLAPNGHRAVSIVIHPHDTADTADVMADPLDILAGYGWDIRDRVVARVEDERAPYGPAWRGGLHALGVTRNRTALPGLFAVGGTAHPGPGVPEVLLGAAAVAAQVGRA